MSTILKKCRACNSFDIEVRGSRSGFPLYIWPLDKGDETLLEDINIYVCENCGYIQLHNIDAKMLDEIYGATAYNIENPTQNIERYEVLTKNHSGKFNNCNVLEIGGGRNFFIGHLPNDCKKYVCDFDVDENILSQVDGCYVGDFINDSFDFNKDGYDYVFLFHVLEHFNQPSSALKRIKDLLKPDGKLVIEVPNFSNELEKIPYYTIFHMHISLFTEDTLKSILEINGFECVEVFRSDQVLFAEFSLLKFKSEINVKTAISSNSQVRQLEKNITVYRNKITSIIENLNDDPIAIFGAGGSTTLFLYNFPEVLGKVKYAFDNDIKKHGKMLCNGKVEILTLSEIDKYKIKHIIVLQAEHIKYVGIDSVDYINVGGLG